MKTLSGASILLAAGGWLLAGTPVAQAAGDPPTGRTQPASFGSGEARRTDRATSLGASFYQAYDDNIFADQGAGLGGDPRARARGWFSGANASLVSDSRGGGVSLAAGSSARYYPALDRLHFGTQSARLTAARPLWRGARLLASGDAGYSPQFRVAFEDAAGVSSAESWSADADTDSQLHRQYRAGLAGELRQAISSRNLLAFTSTVRGARLEGQPEINNAIGAGISLRRQATRYSTMHVGYLRQSVGERFSSRWVTQEASLGVDRRVPLSASRHAAYSISGGATMLSYGALPPRYRLTGDVRMSHELGRRWSSGVYYRRGIGFVEQLPDALLFDSLAIALTGSPVRRLQLLASGAYQRGGVGLSDPSTGYDMYSMRTRLMLSLSRTAAVYAEHFLYHYQFGDAVRLPIGVGRALDRQGAKVGVNIHTFLF